LTQNSKNEKAKALEALGAELLQVNGPLHSGALKSVDVLINAQGPPVASETSDALFKEAIASGVRIYFAPEYGM